MGEMMAAGGLCLLVMPFWALWLAGGVAGAGPRRPLFLRWACRGAWGVVDFQCTLNELVRGPTRRAGGWGE